MPVTLPVYTRVTCPRAAQDNAEVRYLDAKEVLATINKYWNSSDEAVEPRHIIRYPQPPPTEMRNPPPPPETDEWVLNAARMTWERMKVKPWNLAERARLAMTHAGILKLYQVEQRRNPDLHKFFDLIMLDEAQDINDCIADIVLAQRSCRIILVGDPHQVCV